MADDEDEVIDLLKKELLQLGARLEDRGDGDIRCHLRGKSVLFNSIGLQRLAARYRQLPETGRRQLLDLAVRLANDG